MIVGCARPVRGRCARRPVVGWLHDTVALVAERRYGAGRLLASTFQLSAHLADHPVALTMLNDMLRYVTRPA